MHAGTIALTIMAAAILALWCGIRDGLPYPIDRDGAVSRVDIPDRVASEGKLVDSGHAAADVRAAR